MNKVQTEESTDGILRYKIDRMSISFIAVYIGCQVMGITSVLPWWICVIGMCLSVVQVALIQHNHIHLPLCRGRFRALNEFVSILLFLACGVPTEAYFVHHVINHHTHNNKPGLDWSSIFLREADYPHSPMSVWRYVLTFPFRGIPPVWRYIRDTKNVRLRARCLRSLFIVGTLVLVFVWMNPIKAALFIGFPWVMIWLSLPRNNYYHHFGCTFEDELNSSNTDLGSKAGIFWDTLFWMVGWIWKAVRFVIWFFFDGPTLIPKIDPCSIETHSAAHPWEGNGVLVRLSTQPHP